MMPPLPDPALVPTTGNLSVWRQPGSDEFGWRLDLSETIAETNIKRVNLRATNIGCCMCGSTVRAVRAAIGGCSAQNTSCLPRRYVHIHKGGAGQVGKASITLEDAETAAQVRACGGKRGALHAVATPQGVPLRWLCWLEAHAPPPPLLAAPLQGNTTAARDKRTMSGTFTPADFEGDLLGMSADQFAELADDSGLYVVIHTWPWPLGAMRGQIVP